ncbi:Helix-turn-helix type 3 domain protein [Candidatus Magnetobacterium bavaricum]|uniref:Helix-turn-helix type 3 domain protein n=1 Tax=Candidatus Magnetobacterium bavaricum TaxID=29290 RepID=A0A0F3GTT7_9BACT|nr:Helix-turn-helix type 3 domain protein [Candidatus Magnetobacterium bavaricum]
MSIRKLLAANIRLFIEQSGMTQEEVGLKMGFKKDTAGKRMSHYCTGYRSPEKETITKLAEVLGKKEEDFYANYGNADITLPALTSESTCTVITRSKDQEMLDILKAAGINSPEQLRKRLWHMMEGFVTSKADDEMMIKMVKLITDEEAKKNK